MSYKSIDLQTSLPRTVEMTSLQQQQQQRAATEQTLLGQQALKQAEEQAKRSTKLDSTANQTISERQPRHKGNKHSAESKNALESEQEEDKGPAHPYKGKHIDFIG